MAKKQETKAKVSKKAAEQDVEKVAKAIDKKVERQAKEKKVKEPKVATRFRLTDKEIKFKSGGQVELIVGVLKKAGRDGATIADISSALDGKIQTKQTVKSVVGFYMTSFKKAGTVETVAA